jgi:hypothetical protein
MEGAAWFDGDCAHGLRPHIVKQAAWFDCDCAHGSLARGDKGGVVSWCPRAWLASTDAEKSGVVWL